jgi:hypothetical protein
MSVELENKFLDEAEADSDVEPVDGEWGEYGEYQLVGNGEPANRFCGQFMTFKGCLRVDLHNLITFDGVNPAGKVFVRKFYHWCNKLSCPICFRRGWAIRQAGSIEARLLEVKRRQLVVEHVVCSVPSKDYGLDYEALRNKAVKVLKARSVVSGVLIFHAFRYNKRKHWYWSPHFHALGVTRGGYGQCRNCARKWNCLAGCGGFDDRAHQQQLKDGWFLKVLDERKTTFGTAWYQLNYASIKRDVNRFHVATWFGVCSYRKMKVEAKPKEQQNVCPICRHDLVALDYHGHKVFGLNRFSSSFSRDGFEDLVEDGRVVWAESVKPQFRSGSYDD